MASPQLGAFEAALAALRRKERGSAELAAWLEKRGYSTEEADAAITELTQAGELDDERFARRYANDKRELRGWAAGRIRNALAARGLSPELIEAAIGDATPDSEVARASELLRRRGRALDRDADRARALIFLTRRGYDYDAAYEAVRAASRRAT